jgi:decaprenylphospho-beta-D-erythro-pentofuranosid-2-ulose 2-reductase
MKKILIFGATSAIAQATAKCFAQEKSALFLVARHPEKLKIVVQDLKTRYPETPISSYCIDLDEVQHHPSLFQKAQEALQGIDIILIAHSTLGDQKAGEHDFSIAERELRTNFLNIVSLLTLAANFFEQQKHGTLAVITSVAGDRGRQSNYIYGTAKGALSLFLQGLRNRLYPHHVAVVTIKPGFVDTPMTAHLKKGLLFVKPEVVGKGIYKAILKKKNEVYLPCFWWGMMSIIKAIPEWIFKRLKL